MEIFCRELQKGLVYGFHSKPGTVRGHHYHKKKSEWFCVLRGKVKVTLKNLSSGQTEEYLLDGDASSQKIFVPPGTSHTFTTLGPEESFVVAYVSEAFDPRNPDTFSDP